MPDTPIDTPPKTKQLTLDRHFERREEFELAVSLLDMADREKRFVRALYDISADHALRETLSTTDLPCEVRRDRHTIWVVCDQSALAKSLGYEDARTIRRILQAMAEFDPEERLFRKQKIVAKGRERTLYLLSLDELHSLTQIDPDSVIYTAIETLGPNPFARDSMLRISSIDDDEYPVESAELSGGLSAVVSGGLSASVSAPVSAPDVMSDVIIHDDVSNLRTSSSSMMMTSAADQKLLADTEAKVKANMSIDTPPRAVQLVLPPKSFAAIDDNDVRRIANFAVNGTNTPMAMRRALLESYFADAVSVGVAIPADKLQFAQAFMLAGRYGCKQRGPWLRKVWTNFKSGRELQLIPRDKEQAAELLGEACPRTGTATPAEVQNADKPPPE